MHQTQGNTSNCNWRNIIKTIFTGCDSVKGGGSMNKKIFGFLVITVIFAVTLPTHANAFWPFSSGGGQVQGAQTQPQGGGFYEILQKFYHQLTGVTTSTATPSVSVAPTGVSGARFGTTGYAPVSTTSTMGMSISKEQLDKAVAAGKITQAQETEILNQMAAIQVKQQELMSLQTAFRNWMMANHITSVMLFPPRPTGASGASGVSGYQGTYEGHVTGQMPPNTTRTYPPPTGYTSGAVHATGGYYYPQTNK